MHQAAKNELFSAAKESVHELLKDWLMVPEGPEKKLSADASARIQRLFFELIKQKDPYELANQIVRLKNACIDVKPMISAKDSDGRTILHLAASCGYVQSCALIMDEYARTGGHVKELIREKDNAGGTALHRAAWYGYTQCCELILEKYAKEGGDAKELLSMKSNGGKTPLDNAKCNSYIQTCALLMEKGAAFDAGKA